MNDLAELQGKIQLVSGDVVEFHLVGIEAIRRVLESLRAGRIFEEKSLVVAAGHNLVILQPAMIVQIDMPGLGALAIYTPYWADGPVNVVQIEEGTWLKAKAYMDEVSRKREDVLSTPGKSITVLGELRFIDGRTLHIRADLPTPRIPQQQRFLREYFTFPVLEYGRIDGGRIFVNPRQVTAATFYPGAMPHAEAWRVNNFQILGRDPGEI